MPELFNLIRQGRFNELLRRYLQAAGATQLSPELGSYLCLEADRPEWEYLKGVKLCKGSVDITSAVAQFPVVGLLNPTGSNLLMIVTRIVISVGTTTKVSLQLDVQDSTDTLSTARGKIVLDTRFAGAGSQANNMPQAKFLADTLGAADGSSLGGFLVLANTPAVLLEADSPIVLGPNQGVEVLGTNTNMRLTCEMWWTERPMADTERP